MTRPGFLALFVARLHSDAAIRARRIDRATVVRGKERTGHGEQHDPEVGLNLMHQLVNTFAVVVRVCVNQLWLAEDVQLIALDEEWSLAAGPALIAFKSWHGRHSITIDCIRNWTPDESTTLSMLFTPGRLRYGVRRGIILCVCSVVQNRHRSENRSFHTTTFF